MVKRRVYDTQKHIHFVTFSCYKRRKHLQHDQAKRIVIGTMGSRLAMQQGLCLGFVIMPDHVHALLWFPVFVGPVPPAYYGDGATQSAAGGTGPTSIACRP